MKKAPAPKTIIEAFEVIFNCADSTVAVMRAEAIDSGFGGFKGPLRTSRQDVARRAIAILFEAKEYLEATEDDTGRWTPVMGEKILRKMSNVARYGYSRE